MSVLASIPLLLFMYVGVGDVFGHDVACLWKSGQLVEVVSVFFPISVLRLELRFSGLAASPVTY